MMLLATVHHATKTYLAQLGNYMRCIAFKATLPWAEHSRLICPESSRAISNGRQASSKLSILQR